MHARGVQWWSAGFCFDSINSKPIYNQEIRWSELPVHTTGQSSAELLQKLVDYGPELDTPALQFEMPS